MNTDKEFLIRVRADLRQAVSQLKSMSGEIHRTGSESKRSADNLDSMSRSIGFLKRAALSYLTVQTVRNVINQADAYNVLQQRIKTATRATGDYEQVSYQLSQTARQTGSELKTTVSLFQNLARSAPELEATNQQMLQLTELVQQLGVISGTERANLNAGLLQFSQGLSAGVFRAEEFNSLLENIPEVAVRIAKGMGLTVGELRSAVLEGEVLSKDVFDALIKQAPEIAAQFSEIPLSVQRSSGALGTSIDQLLSRLDEATGLTALLADNMQRVADAIADDSPFQKMVDELDELKERRDALKLIGDSGASGWERFKAVLAEPMLPEDRVGEIEKLDKQIAALNQRIVDFYNNANGGEDGGGGELPIPGTDEDSLKKIEQIIAALKEQADTFGQNADQVALYKLEILGADEAQLKMAKSFVESIREQREAAAQMDELASAIASMDTTYLDAARRLHDELERGAITYEEYAKRMDSLDEGEDFDDLADAGEEAMERLEAATRGWGEEFTQALADMVQQGKLDFSSLADSIINDLLRIMIYQRITAPILGNLGLVPAKHSGGIVGAGGMSRTVNPAVFLGAPRMHSGGFAGLRPNEVPTILEKGEEVITRDDPRHAMNQGGASNVRVEMINRGSPQQVTDVQPRVDGREMIISVIVDDLQRGGRTHGAVKKVRGG